MCIKKNQSIFTVILLLAFVSCASSTQKKELIIKRASFDFECKKEEIVLTELGNESYGAMGCGKKGVYLVVCQTSSGYPPTIGDCKAVLNSQK